MCMGQYPAIQEKAQNKLNKILEQDKILAIIDWEWLPYVEVIIKKGMRWKRPLPLGIP